MKKLFNLRLVILVVVAALPFTFGKTDLKLGKTLFVIERSTNKNQVHYDLSVDDSKKDQDNPQKQFVQPYWKMLEKDGQLEDLTYFERTKAYGVEVTDRNSNKITMFVKALRDYPITVHTESTAKAGPFATMRLMGEDKVLKNVYINVSGGLFPSVKWVDIYCHTQAGSVQHIVLAEHKGKWQETLKQ